MNMGAIEDILRRSMGLEASTIGAATVEQAVRGRMAQANAPTPEDYLSHLRDSPGELHELIEAVVVPESWFMRDGAPFAALAHWTQQEWQPTHPGATLRVLTVPCSTGEEPYSVAMTLLGAGLPPERFVVDAVDISRRAIARAQQAVYGPNSFRGQTLDFRERYFTSGPEGYALAAEVRRQVRFETGNVLAADFRPGFGRFDVILCRNLLIYFDRPTQMRAVKALAGMLAPDGLLFVGHAETNIAAGAGFTKANYPMAFAFRKANAVTAITAAPPVRTFKLPADTILPRAPPRVPRMVTRRYVTPTPPVLTVLPPPPTPPVPTGGLDAARALADQGKLEDAARLCEDHLGRHGSSAAAWYLLGVVRESSGNRPGAADCYAKTLYLSPDHEDALLQSALLAEQTGDAATAARMRRRIARVQQRSALS